ncbi:C2H2 zinc finger protein [Plectosphaerella plurivora]|uniref:C2H2 zinc finger protein n=1 Tax=Plectosphaerella plurivora TaxID=936078 RepID=A0A9P9ADW7_9PEZI|nr:C2H2 zinc finger protein [Plectosphaerella plurivora]
MGNQSTKEARPEQQPAHSGRLSQVPSNDPTPGSRPENTDRQRNRQSRFGRNELSLLGIGTSGSSNNREDAPYERRETRQEREARRLERERLAREKERERSVKEEHVDGGYLVTLGTYTGPEDFNKQIVRQLQIDRKIAPFWRGLNDKEDNWTEYQLVCAARGLPIPAADEQPPDGFIPKPQSPSASSQNLANLTVPLGPRTMSAGSNGSASASNVSSALASPTTAQPKRSASPFRARSKALAAALSGGSRNSSTADIAPREINLPHDPCVNSQPLEVALYKDASECPICFLYYPPYLNHTRCCDQAICSECFVQIKRPEPHFPEHHGENGDNDSPEETRDPELLVSEPSQCPYCQQAEFGVTYEPPPFRRGLAHAMPPLSSMSTAMSSQTSLNSTLSPGSPPTGRRRTTSLSANAPNVITTDRVRPDWSSKLAAQRAHQARRAAAATALHTAAFLIGNDDRSRGGFGFSRPGRFSRRNTGQNSAGTDSPSAVASAESPTGPEPGPRGSSGVLGRRSRMEELEDMMFMEAVRLSLAAEEERARKQEKVERKEAKKRLKEERKAAKKADKQSGFYGGGGSANGSSLSLGLGRRRGNSTTSNLRMETTLQSAQSTSSARASGRTSPTGPSPTTADSSDKGKGVERPTADTEPTESAAPASSSSVPSLPIPTSGRGPSHLRQMSNASSISSSLADSVHGSFPGQGNLDGSGSSVPRGDDADRDNSEPLYNFRSLAEMVGVDLENGERVRTPEEVKRDEEAKKRAEEEKPQAEHAEEAGSHEPVQDSVATLKPPVIHEVPEEQFGSGSREVTPVSDVSTPELRITPETPAALDDDECESKRLGAHSIVERSTPVHY